MGDLNDTVTAPVLADRLDGAPRTDLVPAIGALSAQLSRRRQAGLRDLKKRWKAFQAEPRF